MSIVKPKIIVARIVNAEVRTTPYSNTTFVNCKLLTGHFVTIGSLDDLETLSTYYDIPTEPKWTLERLAEWLHMHANVEYRFRVSYSRDRDMIYTRVQLLPKEEQD